MNQSPDLFSFYNTDNSSGKELEQAEAKSYTQEQKALKCFLYGKKTALEIADALGLHESSARRSVTTLFKKGLLIKTNEQKLERYGKRNYYYSLK